MKRKYICEFCGQEFNDPTDCVVHERSHNSLYINNEEIEEYGIMHSGYRAGTAPALLYIPMYKGSGSKEVRTYGRYGFICEVSREDFKVLYDEGEIIDD